MQGPVRGGWQGEALCAARLHVCTRPYERDCTCARARMGERNGQDGKGGWREHHGATSVLKEGGGWHDEALHSTESIADEPAARQRFVITDDHRAAASTRQSEATE